MIRKNQIIKTAISLGVFLLFSILIFFPQLQGKKFKAGDSIEYLAKSQEIRELQKKVSREILWSDAIFSGMPSYFVNMKLKGNIFAGIDRLFRAKIGQPMGLFLLGLVIMFLSLKALKINHWLATAGSIAAVFSVNNFILISAGHFSKVAAVFYLPLLLAGILLLFRSRRFAGGILFSLGAIMTILANHPQMLYYFVIALIPYLIYQAVQYIRLKKYSDLAYIFGIMILGVLLGLAANTSRIWTTMEYANASTRGGSVLKEESQTNTEKGLGWEYAMQWSNDANDLWAALIPGVAGGGSQEPVPKGTELERLLAQSGAPKKGDKYLGPLYWGELPFTAGPIYLGAALILLTVFAFPFLSSDQKWLYGGAIALTLLLSLGKNAAFLNRLLFDHFPMFNNFRAPNSALSILPLFLAFASFTGIDQWHRQLKSTKKGRRKISKKFWIRTGAVAGICFIIAVAGSALFSFEGPNAQNYAQQGVLDVIIDARQALLRQDAWRSFFMVVLAIGSLIVLYQERFNLTYFSMTVGAVLMLDALPVSYRYYGSENFESARQFEQSFAQRPVDQQILANEPDRSAYRVLDYSINTFNTNMSSYYHNTIGGYHALKMSRYQDLIDGYIGKGDQNVLNMLNTKYIINPNGELNMNPNAYGPAWFVENIKFVNTSDEEFRQLAQVDTRQTAIINESEFGSLLDGQTSFSRGTVEKVNSLPDDLIYHTQNEGPGLLVLSELWYDGPGWTAYIDGEEVPLIRADFALRAVLIPAGDHKVELTFRPDSYYVGEKISLGSTLLISLLILFFLFRQYRSFVKGRTSPA